MISLLSGVPGAGKSATAVTLAVEWLLGDPKRNLVTNLPIHVDNFIEYLYQRGWRGGPVQIEKIEDISEYNYMTLSRDTLLILDEVHTLVGRGESSKPKRDFLNFLRESRHVGVEVIIITQDKAALDPAFLRLCGRHLQLISFSSFRLPLIGVYLEDVDRLIFSLTGRPRHRSILVADVVAGRIRQTVERKYIVYTDEIFSLYDSYSAGKTAGGGTPERPGLFSVLWETRRSWRRLVLSGVVSAVFIWFFFLGGLAGYIPRLFGDVVAAGVKIPDVEVPLRDVVSIEKLRVESEPAKFAPQPVSEPSPVTLEDRRRIIRIGDKVYYRW